jgi:tetratricopeptide (TPR) repeat protein
MLAAVPLLFLLGTAQASIPPEELFRQASQSYDAGELELAEARFAELRRDYPRHQLYWFSGLMWARCARDPVEAVKRFNDLMEKAPPDTRAECEIELAHLALVQDQFDEAEKAYSDWLVGRDADERAESAQFYRAWCLKELGREGEATVFLDSLYRGGRQPAWRSEAGLLLAGLRFGSGDVAGARAVYLEMSGADWARDARPQALMGCARTAVSAGDRAKPLKEILKSFPDSGEAVEAGAILGGNKKKAARGKFGVQVGAFSRKPNAVALKKEWDRKGRPASILSRKMGSLSLYAVLLGPFETREEAEREANSIKALGARAIVTAY